MMNVRDMIDLLSRYPDDMRVVVNGYEQGYDDLSPEQMCNENRLLPSPVEQWLRYADARTDTSHDYDGEKAKACLSLVPDFIDDAIRLYRKMSGEAWR